MNPNENPASGRAVVFRFRLTTLFLDQGQLKPASGLGAYGFTRRKQAMIFIAGDVDIWDGSIPGLPTNHVDVMKHTLAHEIGHVFVGAGHPTPDPAPAGKLGPAALPGLPASAYLDRLMVVGGKVRHANPGKLLVKGEWDAAEDWLRTNIDNKLPQ